MRLGAARTSSLPVFATLYSFAAMLGIASHAPGGLGVFEATILQGVGGSQDAVLASLLLPSRRLLRRSFHRRWRCWAGSRRCAAGVRCAKRCRLGRTISGPER